ncbi:MAG TPA: hypothetical protein PLS66_12110, partial [Tepiditoga sp.]|nr:hypothetical protein [Tepiditoga sp.]
IHFLPELTGNTHDIYYKKAGNEYIRQPELEKEEYDINRSDMTWYFDPIIKGSSVWTGPYQWKGEYYISYTKPVFDDGKIIAVVGMDYLKNVMDELLSGKQEYEKENKILINGTKIIYSLAEVSNEYIDEIINLSIKKVDFAQIKNKYIFISKLHNGWDYVNIIDRSEILSSLYYTLIYIALIALIIILIIVIFITEKISIILKPLDIITEKVKKINSENYSESLLIKTDDEIEIVSEALDKMKENLLFSMKTINEKNENINLRNEELTASNEELEAQNNELENLYEEIFKLSNNLKNILNLMSNYDNKKFEIDDFFREIIYNIFNIIPESDEIILYNLYENKVLIPYMTYGTELKNISEMTVKNIFSENRQIYIFKAPSEITDDKKFIKKYENTKNIFMCLINTTGRNMVMFMTLREEDEDYYNENIKDTLNAFIILTKSFITNKNKYDELKEAYILFSSKLAYIAEFHDEITGKHINRVGIISALLAEKMNMKKDFVEDIKIYAPLHDIG